MSANAQDCTTAGGKIKKAAKKQVKLLTKPLKQLLKKLLNWHLKEALLLLINHMVLKPVQTDKKFKSMTKLITIGFKKKDTANI